MNTDKTFCTSLICPFYAICDRALDKVPDQFLGRVYSAEFYNILTATC